MFRVRPKLNGKIVTEFKHTLLPKFIQISTKDYRKCYNYVNTLRIRQTSLLMCKIIKYNDGKHLAQKSYTE